MKINEVEALVGVTKKNIRFYEEQGLLLPRRNAANGYRDYSEAEIAALRQIKLMRKLGVPIAEIRQMQEGIHTVGDGMRRHLITLERERRNLEQARQFCELLQNRELPLNELDAETILNEMENLERAGTVFQNPQRQDVHTRLIGPVAASVVIILFMAAVIGTFAWGFSMNPEEAPPLFLFLTLLALPVLVIAGVLGALYQRIQEIETGEADNSKQF